MQVQAGIHYSANTRIHPKYVTCKLLRSAACSRRKFLLAGSFMCGSFPVKATPHTCISHAIMELNVDM
jgi:hypothetical protein